MNSPVLGQRRLAAILAVDVVSYTRLMGADETGTLRRLKSLRKEFVQPNIIGHNGRIVKLMGDELLAEFPVITFSADKQTPFGSQWSVPTRKPGREARRSDCAVAFAAN